MARRQSAGRELAVAVLGIIVALAYGVNLLGRPLHLVHIITIVAASLAGGIALGPAITLRRESRTSASPPR